MGYWPCLFEESLQLCDQLKGSQLHRQHCLFCVIGCLAQCKDTFDHAGGVVCCHVWTVYFPNRIPSFSSSNVWSRHLPGSTGWMFSGGYKFLALECAASTRVEHPNSSLTNSVKPLKWQTKCENLCRSQRFSWNLDWQLPRWGRILLGNTAWVGNSLKVLDAIPVWWARCHAVLPGKMFQLQCYGRWLRPRGRLCSCSAGSWQVTLPAVGSGFSTALRWETVLC